MFEKRVIRLEPNGPANAGLKPLELDQSDFQSDLPEQNWHVYFEDEALGLTVGVWTTTSMQEAFGPYPGDEFMYLLEGKVVLLDEQNNQTVVNQGETFVVRNGIPVSWKQEGFCRKFFMTYAPQNETNSSLETTSERIIILDENHTKAFTNDSGNMSVGIWNSQPFETEMAPYPSYEFSQILSGELVITGDDGTVHNFAAGDCLFIPAGTLCSINSSTSLKKYYCNLLPPNQA